MLTKLRGRLTKPDVISLALFGIFLFITVFFAITQESEESIIPDSPALEDFDPDDYLEYGEELGPGWTPPGPPRWFRSNSGGMALEETPSRLAALRNKYALVIDYVPPDELEPRLQLFYNSGYIIEVHVLYEQGEETRRQWLFRTEEGKVRLNAVFKPPRPEEPEPEPEELFDTEALAEEIAEDAAFEEAAFEAVLFDSGDFSDGEVFEELFEEGLFAEEELLAEEEHENAVSTGMADSVGFIELYDDLGKITGGITLFEDGGEILTVYIYNTNILVKTETKMKISGDESGEYHAMYTDSFRYNRSHSLRYVDRLYHTEVEAEPVRLLFPSRVLDAASEDNFLSDNLTVSSDFLGGHSAGEGFRIMYETDSRGRILTQTMIDDDENVIWIIKNTWSGDRIISISKTEGAETWLTEYDYDGEGKRVIERNIRNGVLERQIYIEGKKETEELFLNGVVVLRAYWEDGRKINEERVRR